VERRSGAETVRFGTDGWRGVIAREFTFENVGRVAAATARFLPSEDRKELSIYTDWGAEYRSAENGVVVGYDMRFLSREFAHHFARVLFDSGIPIVVSDKPVTTPSVSYAVVDRRAAAGIVITASHNPPIYNGIKYKAEYGGSAPEEVTDGVVGYLAEGNPVPRTPEGAMPEVDLRTPYLNRIRSLIDPERLKGSPVHVVVDSMYGSAQGYVADTPRKRRIPHRDPRPPRPPVRGEEAGAARGEPRPAPRGDRLDWKENEGAPRGRHRRGWGSDLGDGRIASIGKKTKGLLGVVTDGDGDRISAMDEKGGFIDAHRTFALIFRYLVEEKGMRGAVVTSFNLTDMARDMCEDYGLPQIVVPIGFNASRS